MYTKTCTYKNNLKRGIEPWHSTLPWCTAIKKGPTEVNSSIETVDLTLQRGVTSSISKDALSFSCEHFLESHTYCHIAHGLLSIVFPISQAVHLKNQDLLHHKVDSIYISIIPITLLLLLFFQTWTDRTCIQGCWNGLTDINILLFIVVASWISSASYNINSH